MNAALASLLLQAALAAPASPPPEITCFNGGERGKWVGVWHWDGQKSWKRARDDFAPMFAVVFSPGKDRYDEADLPYCFFVKDVVAAKTVKCASGSLEVEALEVGRKLVGRYAFTLEDGTSVEETFEAGYCEPAWPIR
jgi:hypothetical protein